MKKPAQVGSALGALLIAAMTGSEEKSSFHEADPIGVLRAARHEQNHVLFRSRSGTRGGGDSDTDILFSANNVVQLVEHGITVAAYLGQYQADAAGVLSLSLPEYGLDWPRMILVRGFDGLQLRPYRSQDNHFIMGRRGAAIESFDMKPFWPFKQIPSEVENLHPVRVVRGHVLAYFASPQLPPGFEWQGDSVEFRLDATVEIDGSVKVRKHFAMYPDLRRFPWDDPRYGQFPSDDWRHDVMQAAAASMRQWRFAPLTVNGQPHQLGVFYEFTVRLEPKTAAAHWHITSEQFVGNTIYDNMPAATRRIERERSRELLN